MNANIIFILLLVISVSISIYQYFKLKKTKEEAEKARLLLSSQAEELKLFKTIVDKLDLGVSITTPNNKNKVVYINEKFQENTGYTADEVLGKNLKFLQGKEKDQEAIEKIRQAVKKEEPCLVEVKNYKKDGSIFDNLLSITPIFDEKNELSCYIGIQYDITSLKSHEKILAQREKLDSMKELLHNIAHQWRQPLSAISVGATGMKIKQEYGILDDDVIIETCNEISEQTDHLSQIIDDFTSFINTGSKAQKNYDDKNNTSKFINHIDSSLTKHSINLILDLNETAMIKGFSDELIECFVNIFNNSKDAVVANQDENNRYIFISQEINENELIIEFKDNGGGIDENIIQKIFDPYFTTKHQAAGTGLGLHIVNNVIHDLLGKVEVYNEEFKIRDKNFKGAVFKIILPIS